jgi:hypothetical protein
MVQLLILEDQIDLEQALERKGFHLEERNSWRKEKRSEGGVGGEGGKPEGLPSSPSLHEREGCRREKRGFQIFFPQPLQLMFV